MLKLSGRTLSGIFRLASKLNDGTCTVWSKTGVIKTPSGERDQFAVRYANLKCRVDNDTTTPLPQNTGIEQDKVYATLTFPAKDDQGRWVSINVDDKVVINLPDNDQGKEADTYLIVKGKPLRSGVNFELQVLATKVGPL